MRYALHLGVRGPEDRDSFPCPVFDRRDLTDLLGEDGVNPVDVTISVNAPFGTDRNYQAFIVTGSWQEWSEPTAQDVSDFHIVIYSPVPWTKAAMLEMRFAIAQRIDQGRLFDYMITSDADDWSENEQVWTYDGHEIYGPSTTAETDPACVACNRPATHMAAQSDDAGKTIRRVFICDREIEGWYEPGEKWGPITAIAR